MLIVSALLLSVAVTPDAIPNPRRAGGWVADSAGIIPPDAEDRMNNVISRLERDLSAEIAVVTVDQTDIVPKDFAGKLFELWGIGKASADNGLVILLVTGQRRLEMETGYGLEPVLSDGWLGLMQAESMVPAFKSGDYAKGLEQGLSRVDAELRANAGAVREGTRRTGTRPVAAAQRVQPKRAPGYGGWLMLGTVLLLPVGLVIAAARARRRERTCDRCHREMRLLGEKDDDAHLSEGQIAEERLGSVNYLVYVCDPCENMRIKARNKWFSGQSKCGRCGFKTLQSRSVTLVAANYSHGGTVQVTETCAHCHHRHTFTRSTPRLVRSTTTTGVGGYRGGSSGGSRSSGGGSFGGGRSGGGGAGSSW